MYICIPVNKTTMERHRSMLCSLEWGAFAGAYTHLPVAGCEHYDAAYAYPRGDHCGLA